ncbi:MAG TPA: hypothetical protein VM578_05175 [Candidatus Saccharimonadales bacterium]|nr:hypothetical protein [Candidatus Saccharimonadales bacterium]
MSSRLLCVCAFLIFAFSNSTFAQSLGDVARASRAERQRSGAHPKVITNDDIHHDGVTQEPSDVAKETPNEKGGEVASETGAIAKADETSSKSKALNDPAKAREAQELELQKRTNEINQQYSDRIADLRVQIETARAQLTKLQNDQIQSSFEFQRTLGVSPNPATYEQQQRSFNEQIETQRSLITSLNSRLEDAKEAARHAGVPHTTD